MFKIISSYFQLAFKHGNFKYKSKCKIEALGQMWTDPEVWKLCLFSKEKPGVSLCHSKLYTEIFCTS